MRQFENSSGVIWQYKYLLWSLALKTSIHIYRINKHMIHGVIRSDWIISFAQALPSIFTSSSKQHFKMSFHPLDKSLASTEKYHSLLQLSHYSKHRKQNARTDFRFLIFNFRRDLYFFFLSICLNCHFFFCFC